ncbi:NADH-ubiquinone oxidoreductase B18 subunit-domain-containing protein [Gaertneriomyces semiglobifer]|nr:NADH-ubiquinone oxidoreductase B18 subunit-domain-containing protein [Gaertneriomyces semiglobifer]
MHITQEELADARIPLAWRDYCSHLLPALNECRKQNFYLPWKCEFERVAWMKCQYDDYQRRMRKLVKRRAKEDAAKADAHTAEALAL